MTIYRLGRAIRKEAPRIAARFGKAWLQEELKSLLKPELPQLLQGLGEERLRFLVKQNLSLWDVCEDKQAVVKAIKEHTPALLRGIPLARVMDGLGEESMVTVVQEVIQEDCPQFAWIPREWLIKWLNDLHRALK